jgi:hypothetical protein
MFGYDDILQVNSSSSSAPCGVEHDSKPEPLFDYDQHLAVEKLKNDRAAKMVTKPAPEAKLSRRDFVPEQAVNDIGL